jgi:hypothetical protein
MVTTHDGATVTMVPMAGSVSVRVDASELTVTPRSNTTELTLRLAVKSGSFVDADVKRAVSDVVLSAGADPPTHDVPVAQFVLTTPSHTFVPACAYDTAKTKKNPIDNLSR